MTIETIESKTICPWCNPQDCKRILRTQTSQGCRFTLDGVPVVSAICKEHIGELYRVNGFGFLLGVEDDNHES